MPYSITTKDGITINNIPDDVDSNSDVLRERVAAIRGGQDAGDDTTGSGIRGGAIPPNGALGGAAANQAGIQGLAQGLDPEQLAILENARNILQKTNPGVTPEQSAAGQDAVVALASGAAAEPVAGLAGIAQSLNPFAQPGAGAEAVEATRQALTIQPKTAGGQERLQAVAEVVEPVVEKFTAAEEFLGDKTFEITGSPALSAAAKTIPTAILEILGVGLGKGSVKQLKNVREAAKEGKITRELADAVPSIDQLKNTSRAVYQEIDDLGASVKAEAFEGLVSNLKKITADAGIDPDITPKAAKALKRFDQKVDASPSLIEIDTLRQVAQNAASAIEPAEARMGLKIIDTVDQFLDNAQPSDFRRIDGDVGEISSRYKVARDLWGRARRSELIEESFEKARLQASGFENGIRTQFRQILNNKKQKRFFSADERLAMKRVIQGGRGENFAKLVGRLGFSEGGATNILGGLSGVALGGTVGGGAGAVIVPVIGQISRRLAARMTAKNAEFADQVIRAGKDARKITSAYIRNTSKGLRDPAELSELLMRPDIDLTGIQDIPLANNAATLANQNRAALAGAVAPPALLSTQEQQ